MKGGSMGVVGDRDLQRGALVGLLLLKLCVEAHAELLGLFELDLGAVLLLQVLFLRSRGGCTNVGSLV